MSVFFYRRQTLLSILILLLSTSAPAPRAAPGQGIPVAVDDAREQPIYRQVQVTGTVTSPRVAMLSAAASGLVLTVHADEGTRVAEGDALLELDPELARLQWHSARARTEQARNALRDAERRLREARTLVSQRNIAESMVRDLEAEVTQDQAALRQAEADAKYQRALLDRHTVRAPFAGVVSQKLTEQGEWVIPGQGVFELVATQDLRLDFSVAEDYLAHIRQDTQVIFTLNAAPERAFQGRIGTVVPVTNPGARTFLLRVQVEKPDSAIIPGMSVQAKLLVPTGRQGLVVPRDATLRYPDGRVVVWTVETRDQGLVVMENPVRTGLAFDGQMEIREGLSAGARVVVQGNESLQNGQRVYVTTAE